MRIRVPTGQQRAPFLRPVHAVRRGVVVVQSTRAGSGRTFKSTHLTKHGFLIADNLNPQKARLVLALGLTTTRDLSEITRIFTEY